MTGTLYDKVVCYAVGTTTLYYMYMHTKTQSDHRRSLAQKRGSKSKKSKHLQTLLILMRTPGAGENVVLLARNRSYGRTP